MDRRSAESLYAQLVAAIRSRIREGRLAVGARLPSTREAAARLRVNRATIVEAYRMLREEGWVRSGVGSGTFVVERDGLAPDSVAAGGELRPSTNQDRGGAQRGISAVWSSRLQELPRPDAVRPAEVGPDTILLTSPTADPAAYPLDEFRSVLNEIFLREGAACLDYGPADGYAPLRGEIVSRLARQGVRLDPSQVLLVNGSQQGLELAFRFLAGNDRSLMVEQPTYSLALRTARALTLRVTGVPMDGEGLRTDLLERLLDRRANAGLLYTMPAFQNPTGVSLSPVRRLRLLAITRERGLPVLEDHFDADLDYRGDAPKPLMAEGQSPAENLLLLGTFSKILFPGLRVGWLVVPEPLVGPMSEAKVCSDLSGGLLTQMALYEFCRRGLLETHLERIRERNRSRLAAMLSSLERHMPQTVRWTRPTGGMCLWLSLPAGIDGDRVADEALRRGVAVSPGSMFQLNDRVRDGMRLSFIREDEGRIREGIRLLADSISEVLERRRLHSREGTPAPVI